MKIVEQYVRLANTLDMAGFSKEADKLDQLSASLSVFADTDDSQALVNKMDTMIRDVSRAVSDKKPEEAKFKLKMVMEFGEKLLEHLKSKKELPVPPKGSVSERLKEKGKASSQPNLKKAVDERVAKAVQAGEEAFWEAVAKLFPEVKSGDFHAVQDSAMKTAMTQAIEQWLKANV